MRNGISVGSELTDTGVIQTALFLFLFPPVFGDAIHLCVPPSHTSFAQSPLFFEAQLSVDSSNQSIKKRLLLGSFLCMLVPKGVGNMCMSV